jgi:DNA-binding transcriptional MocR family regulator
MSQSSSARIARDLRETVSRIGPGAQLPSSRLLVREYGASPVTVQRALRLLTAEGLIESRPGAGTFVRSSRVARPADYGWQTAALGQPPARTRALAAAMRSAPDDVIALHSGYPDRDLLPGRLVRSALGRATRAGGALSRPPVGGLPELQAWFAHELAAVTPAGISSPAASDVIVLPGSQSGLSSIFRTLVGAGGQLLMESPTYWGAIQAASHARVRVIPIPSGTSGPDLDQLQRAFRETGARVFYAQPHFANPTGAQWPTGLADRVLEIVRDHGAFLVEDDWAHDLAITAETPTPIACSDDSGHVVYLRSLTKSVSPAIRVAALVARGPARERILADRSAESMYVSGLLQSAALDIVTQPAWQTHLRGMRQQLRGRRDVLVGSLREHAPVVDVDHVPDGGLNLWARLPDGTDVDSLTQACQRAGVMIAPGAEWFPAEPAGPFIRLSYAGPDPGRFPDAARVLGRLVG